MSQRAAIRRRRQARMGDRHIAQNRRKWAKATPEWLKKQDGKK